MASVEIEIASRKYAIACRDGEEEHLRSVACPACIEEATGADR